MLRGKIIYLEDDYEAYVEKAVRDYTLFMGITSFPKYLLKFDKTEKTKFNRWATVDYCCSTDTYCLTFLPQVITQREDYKIFHELTHIFDIEKYSKKDQVKYGAITGYTEFHASQIELMKMLGAQHVDDNISFSMTDKIKILSGGLEEIEETEEEVGEYVLAPYNDAVSLFKQEHFPSDFDILKGSIDLLFYFWGRRSVCEMFATDFDRSNIDNLDLSVFINFFNCHNNRNSILRLDKSLRGKENPNQIEKVMEIYFFDIFPVLKKYEYT